MSAQTGQRGAASVRQLTPCWGGGGDVDLRSRCQDVENELVAQVSMKQEMELAMKLLEKDIHEKQVSTAATDPPAQVHTGRASV